MRVLLADQDDDLLDLLRHMFEVAGHAVLQARDGLSALKLCGQHDPHVVLLDSELPVVDAQEVCRRLRRGPRRAIIMMSRHRGEEDEIIALDAGADAYVRKPFSSRVLMARAAAVARGYTAHAVRRQERLRVGDMMLDPGTNSVFLAHRIVRLSPSEFAILFMLAANAGHTVLYSRLSRMALRRSSGLEATALKSHVSHLRSKLNLPVSGDGAIHAKPGIGYCMLPPAV